MLSPLLRTVAAMFGWEGQQLRCQTSPGWGYEAHTRSSSLSVLCSSTCSCRGTAYLALHDDWQASAGKRIRSGKQILSGTWLTPG